MEAHSDPKEPKHDRSHSLREEQAFCREAIDSGAYDALSDHDWIIVCEQVALSARNSDIPEDAAVTIPSQQAI